MYNTCINNNNTNIYGTKMYTNETLICAIIQLR